MQYLKTVISLVLALSVTLALQADISHRKSDLTVQVRSLSGAPLEGATVEVEMLDHAFRFGTAVNIGKLEQGNSNYDAKTVAEITKYFNSITFENAMKWQNYETTSTSRMLSLVDLAKSQKAFNGPNGFRMRGHVTLWGQQMPGSVQSLTDGALVNQRALAHAETFYTDLKDTGIDSYDLYNEHFHATTNLIDKIVPSKEMAEQAAVVATWFNKAKEANPEANLFINEFNILNFWFNHDSDVIAYKNFVDAVRDAGGQVDGIGLQAHMDRMITKEQITRRLNILSAPMPATANHPNGLPGLRVEVTELDINTQQWPTATAEQQATVTRNVLEGTFEHPSADGVTMWVMNDGSHWRGNAIMFDDSDPNNWVVKQSGQVWIDKVLGEWWEDHDGATAASGDYTANTFKGSHKVTVTFNGEAKTAQVSLTEDKTLVFEYAADAADATTYDAWANLISWEDPEDADRSDDADGDGRSNLAEFVDGTNPTAADLAIAPKLIGVGTADAALQYSIRALNTGLTIRLLYSNDLVEWKALEVDEILLNPIIENGIATYTVTLPYAPTYPVFFRVEATEVSSGE